MKIVHVYKDYFPPVRGGIEQTIERLARAQVARGHEVTVLVSASGGRRTVRESVDGVNVVRVAEWVRKASSPICPAFPLEMLRLRADVWHLHAPNPLGEVSWLGTFRRGAMVVTYHGDVVRQKAMLRIYGPVLHRLLARADRVMPTSRTYVERSEFLRPVREKCRVVPLGVDVAPLLALDRGAPAARALRERYGTPLVLFVGRLRYYKGLGVLLDAMKDVRASLVIVGEGEEETVLKEQCGRLGLEGRVQFAGSVSDQGLLDHLAAADVGVLPSIHPSEALGLSMIEYLAAGLPAVCTDLGTGTTFVNVAGETGLVVPPGDPQALARALDELANDEPLRRRLGEGGRVRARTVFSAEAMVENVERVYAEAVATRSQPGR